MFIPRFFIEPAPDVYRAISIFAKTAMSALYGNSNMYIDQYIDYFNKISDANDKLSAISEKELRNDSLTTDETDFLCETLVSSQGCATDLTGWYAGLYYNAYPQIGYFKDKYVVADVHTAPTDEIGNEVGWVKHAGVGPVNMAVIVVDKPDGCRISFAGPVMSYYEYTSTNYKRLTDEEWNISVDSIGMRPDFVNLYLAGRDGKDKGPYSILFTGIPCEPIIQPKIDLINFPNPFNNYTNLSFKVPENYSLQNVELSVYDINGVKIRQLLNQPLSSGNYSARWNAKDELGKSVNEGVYLFKLKIGNFECFGKGSLVK